MLARPDATDNGPENLLSGWGMRVARARRPLLAALAAACFAVAPAAAQDCAFVAEGTAWLWMLEPGPADWAEPAIDDDPETSDWRVGCTPFSSTGCGFAPGTPWEPLTNLVVRQHVELRGGESGLVANVAIDNDFELYFNGVFVGSLAKELCATRWDARLPIPDALLQVGDNVLALRLIDRGGIANFEMTLVGDSGGDCPPGCAQLPCGEPGPALVVPEWEVCPGSVVPLRAEAPPDPRCPTELEYRFRDAGSGTLLRGWGGPDWWAVAGPDGLSVVAEARCDHSPTCPTATAAADFAPAPGPPADPGPVLRLWKEAGGVRVDWSAAPAREAFAHEHVWTSPEPLEEWGLASSEPLQAGSWLDARPGAPRHYLLLRADDCERESAR